MTHGLVTKLSALAILTLSCETASAITINITPGTPGFWTNVTLSVSDLDGITKLRYQLSDESGENWHYLDIKGNWWNNTTPVYECTMAPCTLVVPAPGQKLSVWVRVVVQDRSGVWHFGSKSNKTVTWMAGPTEGEVAADFDWNSPAGDFNSTGTHFGSSARWNFTGRGNNGEAISCEGSTTSGQLASNNSPGTMRCDATLGSKRWHFDGHGRYFESWSGYASQGAWFGCHESCNGTFTDEKGSKPMVFPSIYLRYSKLK